MKDDFINSGDTDIKVSNNNHKFVWDVAKNESNIRKHHVSFDVAIFVFNDDNRIEVFDQEHSYDEDRYDVIGVPTEKRTSDDDHQVTCVLGKVNNLLFVVYTPRIMDDEERIRIISARKANKMEEMLYASQWREV